MSVLLSRILPFIIGYNFGQFNTGKIISKKSGHDLNKEGSGNAGATNAFRVLGLKAGVITFVGDCLKAVIPIILIRILFNYTYHHSYVFCSSLYCGAGALLGHVFPAARGFKGGKGVSTTAGFVFGTKIIFSIIPLVAFFIVAFATGYVSLASITAYTLIIIQGVIFGIKKFIETGNSFYIEFLLLYVLIPVIGIYKHRENIKRLKDGTENRFGHKKK